MLLEDLSVVYLSREESERFLEASGMVWDLVNRLQMRVRYGRKILSVALVEGRVAGVIFDGIEQNETDYSFDVMVDPEFRERGIGTHLVDLAMAEFVRLRRDHRFFLKVVHPSIYRHLVGRWGMVLGNVTTPEEDRDLKRFGFVAWVVSPPSWEPPDEVEFVA